MSTFDPMLQQLDSPAPRIRVLALRWLAIECFGVWGGVAWLISPSESLLGVAPGAAAWHSPRLAKFAASVLVAYYELDEDTRSQDPAAGVDSSCRC